LLDPREGDYAFGEVLFQPHDLVGGRYKFRNRNSMSSVQFPLELAFNLVPYIPASDRINLLLVNKEWSLFFAEVIYREPTLPRMDSFVKFMRPITSKSTFHFYPEMVHKLDISGVVSDNVYMGDLVACLKRCLNLKSFKLERCFHISSQLLDCLATHCCNLEEVFHL
jgi:hypothetical protein